MKDNIIYNYDPDSMVSTVILEDKYGHTFCGSAIVHPDDKEYASELTGLSIANQRAEIQAINEMCVTLSIELAAYNKLYYSINQSKKYDDKHYEAIMLKRKIKQTTDDLNYYKQLKQERKKELKDYLNRKQIIYKRHKMGKNNS